MSKTSTAIYFFLAVSQALAQSSTLPPSPPCSVHFGETDDRIIRDNPQISDPAVLTNVLQYISLSGATQTVKEQMIACAYQRHKDAARGLNQPSAAVPSTFAPAVNSVPTPMTPATAPQVQPMRNYAPDQLMQNGQTLMETSQQLMMMANAIDALTPATPSKPKQISVVAYRTQAPIESVFDETVKIMSAQKYEFKIADKSRGMIKAVKTARDSGTVYACVFVSISSKGDNVSLQAMFGRYSGFLGGGSPTKWAAAFEKDLKAIQPDIQKEN